MTARLPRQIRSTTSHPPVYGLEVALGRLVSRDFKKLEVFHLADQLVVDVYRATLTFPVEEQYGLQAQLRRASVSVPSNIVEGSARESNKEYAHFLRVACGFATEARYLFSIARRLQYLEFAVAASYEDRFDHVVRSLEALAQRVAASAPRAN